jgi:hypothetical protein
MIKALLFTNYRIIIKKGKFLLFYSYKNKFVIITAIIGKLKLKEKRKGVLYILSVKS